MIIHLKDVSWNPCGLARLSLDCSVNNNWLPAVEYKKEGGFSFTGYRAAVGSTASPLQWVLGPFSSRFKRPVREADVSTPGTACVKNV